MAEQLPRKIPPSPPDWEEYLGPNYSAGPILIELTGRRWEERNSQAQGNEDTQALIDRAYSNLQAQPADWVDGLSQALFLYEIRDYAPDGDVRMGSRVGEYEFNADTEDMKKWWPFVDHLEVTIIWLEIDDMSPLYMSLQEAYGSRSFDDDIFTIDLTISSNWTAKPFITLGFSGGPPRVYLKEEEYPILSAIPAQYHNLYFNEITSQDDFNWFWESDDEDGEFRQVDNQYAPTSMPIFPLVREGVAP